MRTANEIALETKVEELEKEMKGLKEFESQVCLSCAKLMMSVMLLGEGNSNDMAKIAMPAFDNLMDTVKRRMENKIKNA